MEQGAHPRSRSATIHFTQFALLETNKIDTFGGCNLPAAWGEALEAPLLGVFK